MNLYVSQSVTHSSTSSLNDVFFICIISFENSTCLFWFPLWFIIEYYKFLRLNFSYGILSILRLIKSCSRLLHDLGEAVDFYIIGEKTILWGKDSKESNRRIHSQEKIDIRNDLIVFISWCKLNPFLQQRNARFKCVKSVNSADCFVGTMANTQ